MRFVSVAAFLILSFGCAATGGASAPSPPQTGGDPRRTVSLQFGERRLDSTEFPGIDEPAVAGVEVDWYRPEDDFGYEIGLYHSSDEMPLLPSGKFETRSSELSFGVRRTFELVRFPRIFPYVGLGVSVFDTEKTFRTPTTLIEQDDIDSGLYLRAGVRVRLAENVYLGLDARAVSEELFDYGGFDMDYRQLAVSLGFGF